ncbi:MAG: Stk1 family PASTA domain-containing Ser/Thr kinase [Oscillospiraceae bacterium]|nr:Stk1 family PASTA domain-containing Ser/Thr kinase [Oscillospiraceae bacterium]
MDKYIGRLLDNRYEILEIIGTGGMAVVYKARCHRLNRMVAVKILKDDNLGDEDFRRRFHAESQAVAMLSHPNIVSVYDVSTSIMADYIVMELIEGISLKEYMQTRGTLNWKETLHFGIQIAKALEHAHSRGIVHRDIKPHNVMVLKNGSVKVTDFGIARMMSKGNTLTKEALGSVHYISPEQAKGGRVDTRSDIYSLGVVMYEMMAGRPPYDGDSPVSVAIQHISGGAPMPSTYNPNIPGGLEQIIMRAMALEIDDRYTTATQMLQDMDEFRKDPTMLFDYNVPPLDAVIHMSKNPIPLVVNNPKTTAQKVAGRTDGQRPRGGTGQLPRTGTGQNVRNADPVPRRTSPENRRKREEELRRQRNSRMATIAIISCSLVAVVALVIFLITLFNGQLFNKPQKLVEVPLLVGEIYEDLPDYSDFDIRREDVYDDSYPAGMIIDQKPDAGDKVVVGTQVIATVSLGEVPKVVKMDDLVNMDESSAKNLLLSYEMDLNIVIEEEPSEDVEVGKVIRTIPEKGKELRKNDNIILYVSTGPEINISAMPNVVNKSEDAARNVLNSQKLDLDITVKEIYDSNIEKGNVVKTEPAGGEELKTGQKVTLYISKGPELKTVPNVIGMDIDTAVSVLTKAGFKTPSIEYMDSDEEKNTVIKQNPGKNTEWDINEVIELYISKGPAPTEPTEPTTEPTEPQSVTKDVVLNLQGMADDSDTHVAVTRDGSVIYEQTVPKGTKTITIPGQTGTGTVTYNIVIDHAEGWSTEVVFTN